MSFFERLGLKGLLGKKREVEKEERESVPSQETEKKNIDKVITVDHPKAGQCVAKFIFKDKNYILNEFNLSFGQELANNKCPSGLPKGGIITLVLETPPDDTINEWIQKENLLSDGEIRFFPRNKRIDESATYIIHFIDAYCVGYKKEIDPEKGLHTTLTISPRIIKVGDEEFENNWKLQPQYSHYIQSK